MNEENKNKIRNDIMFLENFVNKNKDIPLKTKQPIKIKNCDIFGEEEEKVENPAKRNNHILRAANKSSLGVIQRKYDIAKESTIFQETDTKKGLESLSNIKTYYKNYLYNTIIKNKELNNKIFNSTKNDGYYKKKSTLNLKALYETKLANVSR